MMRWCLAAAVLGLSLGVGGPATAEPLPQEHCDTLQAEQTGLTTAGIRAQMERGAEWGRANLSPEQLKLVERFIAVDEQLSFRCGHAKLRASLPVAEEGGEQELDDKGNPVPAKAKPDAPDAAAKPKPRVVPKAKAKKPSPAAQVAAPSDATAKSQASKSEAQPAAGATPRRKPVVDDAYRPPKPKDAETDPFAGTAAPATKKK